MAENDREKRGRKLLLTLLVIGVVGSIAGIGTFSAFSDTTENSGNTFAAGTVYIVDNDAGAAMYNATNQGPGDSVEGCITVTYLGSLDSAVRLYANVAAGAINNLVNVQIEEGSTTTGFNDCSGFTSSGTIFNDRLNNLPSGWAGGVATGPSPWAQNDAVAYRFTVSLVDNNSANGGAGGSLAAGSTEFVWEARNV